MPARGIYYLHLLSLFIITFLNLKAVLHQAKLREAKGDNSRRKYSENRWSLYKPVSPDRSQF